MLMAADKLHRAAGLKAGRLHGVREWSRSSFTAAADGRAALHSVGGGLVIESLKGSSR